MSNHAENMWIVRSGKRRCWLMVLGNVIIWFFLQSTLLTFGVVVDQLTVVHGFSHFAVSMVPAILISLAHLLSPLSDRLQQNYSHFFLSVLGILVTSIGICLCSISEKLPWFYIGYGIFGGLGYSLTIPRGLHIIKEHFGNRKNAAQNISSLGTSLSLALMPILMYYLCLFLTLRGAMLVWSAILLNALIGAMFYRQHGGNFTKNVNEIGKRGSSAEVKETNGGQSARISQEKVTEVITNDLTVVKEDNFEGIICKSEEAVVQEFEIENTIDGDISQELKDKIQPFIPENQQDKLEYQHQKLDNEHDKIENHQYKHQNQHEKLDNLHSNIENQNGIVENQLVKLEHQQDSFENQDDKLEDQMVKYVNQQDLPEDQNDQHDDQHDKADDQQSNDHFIVPVYDPVYVQRSIKTRAIPIEKCRSISQQAIFKSLDILPQIAEDVQSLSYSRGTTEDDKVLQRRPQSYISILSSDSFATCKSYYYSTDRISSITQYFDTYSSFSTTSEDNNTVSYSQELCPEITDRNANGVTNLGEKEAQDSVKISEDKTDSKLSEEIISRSNGTRECNGEKSSNDTYNVMVAEDESKEISQCYQVNNSTDLMEREAMVGKFPIVVEIPKKSLLYVSAISASLKRQVYYSYIIYLPVLVTIVDPSLQAPYLLSSIAAFEFLSRMTVTSIPRIANCNDTRYSNVFSSVLCCISLLILLFSSNYALFLLSSCAFGLSFGAILFSDHANICHMPEIKLMSIGMTVGISLLVYPIQGWLLDSYSSISICIILLIISFISLICDVYNAFMARKTH